MSLSSTCTKKLTPSFRSLSGVCWKYEVVHYVHGMMECVHPCILYVSSSLRVLIDLKFLVFANWYLVEVEPSLCALLVSNKSTCDGILGV